MQARLTDRKRHEASPRLPFCQPQRFSQVIQVILGNRPEPLVRSREVPDEAACEGRHEVGEDSKSETHPHFRFRFPGLVIAFAFGVSVWI
jgi:hypothetical protein